MSCLHDDCLHDDTSDAACYQATTPPTMLDTDQTRALREWRMVQAEHRAIAVELEDAHSAVQAATQQCNAVASRYAEATSRCGKARRAFLATLGDE